MALVQAEHGDAFVDAVKFQGPVEGLTHGCYKYPARFSPIFVRQAIHTFTRQNDVILDPFAGGGTTLVEARLAGRDSYGSDISSLAVFLSQAKTIPLSESDLQSVSMWMRSAVKRMNIHRPVGRVRDARYVDYDKNMPWPLRKLCEQYLERIEELRNRRQNRFARCVLLRCGQWAMDSKDRIPSASEFRDALLQIHEKAATGMREFRRTLEQRQRAGESLAKCKCVQASAIELEPKLFGSSFSKADVVVTSLNAITLFDASSGIS